MLLRFSIVFGCMLVSLQLAPAENGVTEQNSIHSNRPPAKVYTPNGPNEGHAPMNLHEACGYQPREKWLAAIRSAIERG